MRLSEIKGERAIEVIADLIDPVSVIASDDEFRQLLDADKKVDGIKYLLKKHSKEVLTCMAILNDEDPKTYSPSFVALPAMLLELLNTPELVELFYSGGTVTSSGSPTESTEDEKN